MTEQTYDKKCVALAQVQTALRLYFEGEDYFSVITLAGAAEEIFGKFLSTRGIDNSLESIKKGVAAMHQKFSSQPIATSDIADRANRARNAMKHPVTSAPTLTLDAKEEAEDMLHRAIYNYWRLEEWLTPAMDQFQRAAVAA